MVWRTLRDVVVVGLQAMLQRGLQLVRRGEPGLIDQLRGTAIETLNHPVGLRVARKRPAIPS